MQTSSVRVPLSAEYQLPVILIALSVAKPEDGGELGLGVDSDSGDVVGLESAVTMGSGEAVELRAGTVVDCV